MKKKNKEQTTE